jgi:triosephosphate isomerase
MSETGNGAFTGEVSGEVITDFNLQWVIIGHSERRTLFIDSDASVAWKIERAQKSGLNAIVCIGEKLEDFVLSNDVKGAMDNWAVFADFNKKLITKTYT